MIISIATYAGNKDIVACEHRASHRISGRSIVLFSIYEMPYPEFSDALKIGDHAHAVLGSITLIQMLQPVAWKAVTAKAVFGLAVRQLFAVLDFAFCAGFRFRAIVDPATWAWFSLSLVNARQRRQFMPQGAISSGEIAVAFVDLFDFIS